MVSLGDQPPGVNRRRRFASALPGLPFPGAPHYAATEERVCKAPLVLVAQDTTTLNYSSHPHTRGLGPIGTDNEAVRGLMVHDTMAFTPQGTPLGLLDLQCWAREGIGHRHARHQKPIEEKESFKWVESYHAVSKVARRPEGEGVNRGALTLTASKSRTRKLVARPK